METRKYKSYVKTDEENILNEVVGQRLKIARTNAKLTQCASHTNKKWMIIVSVILRIVTGVSIVWKVVVCQILITGQKILKVIKIVVLSQWIMLFLQPQVLKWNQSLLWSTFPQKNKTSCRRWQKGCKFYWYWGSYGHDWWHGGWQSDN